MDTNGDDILRPEEHELFLRNLESRTKLQRKYSRVENYHERLGDNVVFDEFWSDWTTSES